MTWELREQSGLVFYKSSILENETWLDHGMTIAVQDGESFNLGLKVDDDPERVVARRRRVAEAFGVDLERTVYADQVHGRHVAWVDEERAGAGCLQSEDAVPATDGLATSAPGLLLATQHADCVPILVADPVHKAVAAVHAGWKGTAAAIVRRALEVLQEKAGSIPGECKAAIGPAAGECCYEVGEDLREKFEGVLDRVQMKFTRHLPLGEVNRRLLIEAGLPESSIDLAGLCTICGGGRFFSHRRQGRAAGRSCSYILRKG